MKKSQILTLLFAAAALLSLSTACQKTLDRSEPRPSDGGKGYVSLSFNLPAVSGTKDNDQFHAGEEEYEVKEVIVAFFYGASESDAVCKYAVRIGEAHFIFNAHNSNITTKYSTGALEIPTKEESEKVYVLAVLNPADYISVTADSRLSVSGETDNLKLSKLQEFVPVGFDHENGFMMTNAPYAPAHIEDIIITLPEVTVYNEKSEAEDAVPTSIYVERVEAKVTLEAGDNINDNTFTVAGNTAFAGDKVTLNGWVLQNTNKTYCPVRKTDVSWFDYGDRFVGGAALTEGIGKNFRIYWAIDDNYEMIPDEAELTNNFNIITAEPADWNDVDSYTPQYCAENTTLAKAMNKKQLTGVLIKATYIPDSFTEGAADFILTGPLNRMYTTAEFITSVKSALNLDAGIEVKIIATKGMTVTDAAGLKELMTVDGAEPTDAQAAAILSAFGNSIRFYNDGVCYYTSLIRHFDDEQTPLTDGSVSDESDYMEEYHLGRYGVVRNNWYQLTVTSVSGPGEPDIPEIPDEPADARESYINCEINILSWAVRGQEVVL